MDKFMAVILPRDVLSEVFSYSFEIMINNVDGKVYPIYEYVANTFAKNTSYMENMHCLRSSEEERERQIFNEHVSEEQRTSGLTGQFHAYNAYNDNELSRLMEEFTNATKIYNDNKLLEEFKNATKIYYDLINVIMKTNNISMLKHLYETRELDIDTIYSRKLLENASLNGSIEMLKYLVKISQVIHKYSIGVQRDIISRLLQNACTRGHLKMTKFLVELFKLTRTDMTKNKLNTGTIFQLVCKEGHVEILKYLRQVFKLRLDDFDIKRILEHVVIKNSDLHLLTYLTDTYHLTSGEAQQEFDIVYIYYLSTGEDDMETDMSRYIEKTFRVSQKIYKSHHK